MNNADILKMLHPRSLGSIHDQDLAIIGSHLDAADARVDDLIAEMHPDTATETIADWERVYDILPPDGAALSARRLAVVQKKRVKGSLTRAYFVSLAAAVGYTITIEELPPNAPTYGWESIWVWRVHVVMEDQALTYFRAGESYAGDYLTDWDTSSTLEGILTALKPSHTDILFVYPSV